MRPSNRPDPVNTLSGHSYQGGVYFDGWWEAHREVFFRMFFLRILLVAASCLAGLPETGAAGQAQPRTPERGADQLAIQFSVVTDEGGNIGDLRADEVTLRLGGRLRPLRSLQLITVGGSGDDGGLPRPYGSNAGSAAGRSLAIVVDDESFRPGLEGVLRGATDGLIAALGEEDRLSLVTLPLGGTRVPLTTDHSRVRAAMAQVVGHRSPNESGSDLACRTRRTLESLVTWLESGGIREEPLTVIFVTSGLAAPRRDAVTALAPGMCELSEHLFARVGVAAGAARARVYVIRPGDASDGGAVMQRETSRGSDNPLAGMEHLTGATGGKLLALTGSTGSGMDRVLRETAAYYLATIDARPEDRSGRTQALDINVARGETEVRSTPQITIAKPFLSRTSPLQPSLRDMLLTRGTFRNLPLRAAAFPALAGGDGDEVRVVTIAEAAEPGVTFEALGAVLFDPDGTVAAQWQASAEQLRAPSVMGAMAVQPGAYRLRVAALDEAGRSGAADYEVTATIVKSGPLSISSLVLGLMREGRFVPRLQFSSEPLAVAYVELDGAPEGARVTAAVEVAQSLNGAAILTVPLAVQPGPEGRYIGMGSVAVGALPPGDYIVRGVIGLEGHPPTRVVRTLRKR
jgi:hypothetical protein